MGPLGYRYFAVVQDGAVDGGAEEPQHCLQDLQTHQHLSCVQVNILIRVNYRDRRVERQRRWPEVLFRRLATLHLSKVLRFLQNQIKFIHTICPRSLDPKLCDSELVCILYTVTHRILGHLCVQTYKQIFVLYVQEEVTLQKNY